MKPDERSLTEIHRSIDTLTRARQWNTFDAENSGGQRALTNYMPTQIWSVFQADVASCAGPLSIDCSPNLA